MKAVCTGAQHHPNVLALHGAVSNIDASTSTLLHQQSSTVFTIHFHCSRSQYWQLVCQSLDCQSLVHVTAVLVLRPIR